ncbi:MAG: hypothetical protein AUJ48_01050 [Deltaproteobacteria bacterium CG1_02_45_11]|nr:MAG: hypothetical protein AUJ48_01050 [Deltaproteobacteria bacterium CG1_02_45_11]
MKLIKKLLLLCSIFIFIVGISMPKEASGITVEQEREMGREFMKAVLKEVDFIEDPLIVNYVNKIGQKIVSVFPDPLYTYHFYVIKEESFNAFAAPAGHVFINSGLLEAMENEEELAGILAHEIAHVHCRHLSQKLEKSSKINMLTLAGIAAGIFLGTGGSGEAANALIVSSMAAGQSIALAYSRENEMQADQIGLKYLTEAGYNCAGLLSMLKKIRSKSWFGSQQIPTYLTTHPASEERIAYIGTWGAANQEKASQTSGQATKKDSSDFAIVHAKLIAMYGEESAALRKFEDWVGQDPSNPMAHYAYGLVLARTGNRQDATNHLKIALEKKAFDPYILNDLGKMYYLDNRYEEAVRMLENSFDTGIDDSEAQFFLGCAQLKTDKLEEAASTLTKLLKRNPISSQFEPPESGKREKKPDQVDIEEYNKRPQYFQALYYLGEIYHKQGRPGDAHFYLGWYFMTKTEFENAKFHLSKALEIIKDPDKKIKIQKMLKAIQAMPWHQRNMDNRKTGLRL